MLKALEERIEEMEAILKERAKITDEAKWLMSIPSIGYTTNKSEERGKSGNRCNSSSLGGIGLLGADKKGIL